MANTEKKLQLLRTLIEHPRTSDTEREAAKRAMERVLRGQQGVDIDETVKASMGFWGDYARTYGSKYQSSAGYMTAAEIAKLVRADIKLALKVARETGEPGALALVDPLALIPAGVKVTVKTDNYSGGRSIDVVIRNIPEDWGFSMQPDHYSRTTLQSLPTPELKAAAKALKEILQAYNYNGSRPEVDYFDVNYYGHVISSSGLILA